MSAYTAPPTPNNLSRQAPDLGGIPRYVQYTSPVSLLPAESNGHARASALPLNIIAIIVSYLDDIGDIARVTRTGRLLYYMTIPQLYEKVALHSYADIRYVNGRPEGFGGGSPFMMALNGLVTKSHANIVKELRVWGNWRETGAEDFAKGRVPENNMMLNILLRAATDKMSKLQSFAWELDCKPLKTLYQGLAAHDTLTSLTIKFPSARLPRPSVLVPPMANLRAFRAMDIDPLCYPDDISLLIAGSSKLEDLRLHFSPRIRAEAESSLSLDNYFGRSFKAGRALRLKHFAMQNFYGPMADCLHAVDMETCKSAAFIDVFGGSQGNFLNAFIDDTWRHAPKDKNMKFTSCRTNEMAPNHAEMVAQSCGLERMYFISAKPVKTGWTPEDGFEKQALATPESPSAEIEALGKDYIAALTQSHGSTLTHLLLSDQWSLTPDDVGDIVRSCPNLEQLGIGLNSANHSTLRLLLPFLPKLQSVRLLYNEFLAEHMRIISHEERLADMSREFWKSGAQHLRWVGLGDTVYRVGKVYEVTLDNGKRESRREVTMATLDDVRHVEIWKMDCLDISIDPVAPFSP